MVGCFPYTGKDEQVKLPINFGVKYKIGHYDFRVYQISPLIFKSDKFLIVLSNTVK